MHVLINLIVGILSQYTQLSSYHIVYFKIYYDFICQLYLNKAAKSKFLHML